MHFFKIIFETFCGFCCGHIPVFAFYVYTTASVAASCRSLVKVDEQLFMYFFRRGPRLVH